MSEKDDAVHSRREEQHTVAQVLLRNVSTRLLKRLDNRFTGRQSPHQLFEGSVVSHRAAVSRHRIGRIARDPHVNEDNPGAYFWKPLQQP